MAKAFSVASWNVEHFGATSRGSSTPRKPIDPIIDFLASQKADVVAVYEVVGKVVFNAVITKMPGYQWHITEGPQTQEILVGVKKSMTSFFTQKQEFKSGNSFLRPGGLLTVRVAGEDYPLLFLHLKSLSVPVGFGLRDDMTEKAIKFRKVLNKLSRANGGSGSANFIFLGDLNTMGMNLTYSSKDLSGAEEIARLKKRLGTRSVQMRILDKTAPTTYWPGTNSSYEPSDLDHAVASDHLDFKSFAGADVDVRGWVDKGTDSKKDAWTKKYSDHALLYFEIQKV